MGIFRGLTFSLTATALVNPLVSSHPARRNQHEDVILFVIEFSLLVTAKIVYKQDGSSMFDRLELSLTEKPTRGAPR